MSRSWKSRVGVLALTATMGIGIVGIASPAGAAGNSANAKACQNNGWKTLVRADQTSFKNQGDCVSYAAQGGTPQSPKSASQLACESVGGTFASGTGNVFWTCNGWPAATGSQFDSTHAFLTPVCFAAGGTRFTSQIFGVGFPTTAHSTCDTF